MILMSTNDRKLVLLRIENGLTYREIADKMEINQSTVVSKIRRYVCFMYRDFIYCKHDLNHISVLYKMSTDICLKCLKEAEKNLHIGACQSVLPKKG